MPTNSTMKSNANFPIFQDLNIELDINADTARNINSGVLLGNITFDDSGQVLVPFQLDLPEAGTQEHWILSLSSKKSLSLSAVTRTLGVDNFLNHLPSVLKSTLNSVSVSDIQFKFSNDLSTLIQTTFTVKIESLDDLVPSIILSINSLQLRLVIDDPLDNALIQSAELIGSIIVNGRLISINVPLSFSPWMFGDLGLNLLFNLGPGFNLSGLTNLFSGLGASLGLYPQGLPNLANLPIPLGLPAINGLSWPNIDFVLSQLELHFSEPSTPGLPDFNGVTLGFKLPGTIYWPQIFPNLLALEDIDVHVKLDGMGAIKGGELLGTVRMGYPTPDPLYLPFVLNFSTGQLGDWSLKILPEQTLTLGDLTRKLQLSNLSLPIPELDTLNNIGLSEVKFLISHDFKTFHQLSFTASVNGALNPLGDWVNVDYLKLNALIERPFTNTPIFKKLALSGQIMIDGLLFQLDVPLSLDPWPFGDHGLNFNINIGPGFNLSRLTSLNLFDMLGFKDLSFSLPDFSNTLPAILKPFGFTNFDLYLSRIEISLLENLSLDALSMHLYLLGEFNLLDSFFLPNYFAVQDLRLKLSLAYDSSNGSTKIDSTTLVGIARFGEPNDAIYVPFELVSLTIDMLDHWILTLLPDQTLLLAQLMNCLGQSKLLNQLPQSLAQLGQVGLRDVQFKFNDDLTDLLDISLNLHVEASWTPIPDALQIDNLHLRLEITNPTSSAAEFKLIDLSGQMHVFHIYIPFYEPWPFGELGFNVGFQLDPDFNLLTLLDLLPSIGATLIQPAFNLPSSKIIFDFLSTLGFNIRNMEYINLSMLHFHFNPDLSFSNFSFSAEFNQPLSLLSAIFEDHITIEEIIFSNILIDSNFNITGIIGAKVTKLVDDLDPSIPLRIAFALLENQIDISITADTPLSSFKLANFLETVSTITTFPSDLTSVRFSSLKMTLSKKLKLLEFETDIQLDRFDWPPFKSDIIRDILVNLKVNLQNNITTYIAGQAILPIKDNSGYHKNVAISWDVNLNENSGLIYLSDLNLKDGILLIKSIEPNLLALFPVETWVPDLAKISLGKVSINFNKKGIDKINVENQFSFELPNINFAGKNFKFGMTAIGLNVELQTGSGIPNLSTDLNITIPADEMLNNQLPFNLLASDLNCRLTVDFQSIALKLRSWPLLVGEANIIEENNSVWADINFSEESGIRFELPTIRYDGASTTATGIITQEKLEIPLNFLKNILSGSLLDRLSGLLPDSIPFGSLISPGPLTYSIRVYSGGAVSLAFGFPESESPLKIKELEFGEFFGFLTVRISADFGYIDPIKEISCCADKVFLVISPAGTPVGAFFDKLSLDYKDVLGFKIEGDYHFPAPGFEELAAIIGKLSQFITKPDKLTSDDITDLVKEFNLEFTANPILKITGPQLLGDPELVNLGNLTIPVGG